MLLDRHLKRLLVVAASAVAFGFTAFIASPATAKDPAKSCPNSDEVPVVQVDENTIICREVTPAFRKLGVQDALLLYRYCRKGNVKLRANITIIQFSADDMSGIHISEYKQCHQDLQASRSTEFLLRGRKFDQWSSENSASHELRERYRQDVTRLLNAAEKFPAKPTF